MRTLYSRWQKNLALIALFIFAFGGASFARAQDKPSEALLKEFPDGIPFSLFPNAATVKDNGVVNCFDYYRFGSVQVNMEANITDTVSGTPILFSGKIENQNNYPIVDGAVYAKVFRKQNDQSMTYQNGNDLVDQFFVKTGVTLSANSVIPLQFEWKIPAYAMSGDYQIAFFFTSAHKFNLLGLSFTDDVTGNTVNFSLIGEQKQIPFFNKNAVKLNGSIYRFAAFPPRFGRYENVIATANIANPTNKLQVVRVEWKLYNWDAQNESNVMDTKKEDIALNPGETRTLTYTDTKMDGVVHLLVAEAKYEDTKSILNIRYVRDGVDAIRLNFPSVTSYPLQQNKEVTLFSCVHNTGANTVPDSKLTLTLKDQNGKSLHTYTYTGAVSSAMMAVKDSFIPAETLKTFSLEAKLWQNGKQIDEATMTYDCEKLGGKDCPKKATLLMGIDANTLKIDIALFILLLIVLSLIFLKKRKQQKQENMKSPIKILAFAILITASWSFGGVHRAEASSVSWSSGVLPNLWYCWSNGRVDGYCGGYTPGLFNAQVTIQRNAQMKNTDTGAIILSGSTVPAGTRITFETPEMNTDISWFGTGATLDSPYGRWLSNAEPPGIAELPDFFVGTSHVLGALSADIYIPLSVHRPTKTMSNLVNLSCSGMNCTVTGTGNISAEVIFPATYGKFYYQYICPGCSLPKYYNKVSMKTVSCTAAVTCPVDTASPYQMTVPQQSILFSLTGIAANDPPTLPTITPLPANNYYVSILQRFNIKSTDPDGDMVKYCVDWGNDGLFNNNCGALSDLQAQNTNWLMIKNFSTTGDKTFGVKAIDSRGSSSPWKIYTYTVINQPEDGVCSTSSHDVCLGGAYASSPADTTANYKWSCNGLYGGDSISTCSSPKPINATCGTTNNSCPKGGTVNNLLDSPTAYYWECPGLYGGTNITCSLSKTCPNNICTSDATCTLPRTSAPVCTGTLPSFTTILPGDDTPLVDTPYTYSASPGTTAKCEYDCAAGYSRIGGVCVPSTNECQGTLPNGVSIYERDDANLPNNTTSYTYSATDTSVKCQYRCDDGYVRYGGSCRIPYCTGTAPSTATHTEVYSGDDTGIAVSLPLPSFDYSDYNTPTKCEFKCSAGYVRNGTICISDGLCGTANAKIYSTNVSPEQFAPDTLCDVGPSVPATVSFPIKGQSVSWTCGPDRCAASRQWDAKCGYKKGIPSFIAPTATSTSLCIDGTRPAVTPNTTVTPNVWEWTCSGWFDGADALCTAPKSTFKFWEF